MRWILKLTPSTKDDEANILAAHEEIRGAIDLQTKEGTVARHDANMLGGVLDLSDLQVCRHHGPSHQDGDVRRRRSAPARSSTRSCARNIRACRSGRTSPRTLSASCNTKDLLSALARVDWDVSKLDIMSFAGEPWFVPDTTSLKDQLNQFLKRKAQMALVVDEYGEVQGLDHARGHSRGDRGPDHRRARHGRGAHPAPGRRHRQRRRHRADPRLNRHMDWDLPDEEATTIAGLIVHEAQMIPEPGQVFTFHGYRMEILRRSRNKIAAVRIKRLGANDETERARSIRVAGRRAKTER